MTTANLTMLYKLICKPHNCFVAKALYDINILVIVNNESGQSECNFHFSLFFSLLCFHLFFYILLVLFFFQISLVYLQLLFEFLCNMRVRKTGSLASLAINEGNSSSDASSMSEEKVVLVNFLLYIASGEDVSREGVDRVRFCMPRWSCIPKSHFITQELLIVQDIPYQSLFDMCFVSNLPFIISYLHTQSFHLYVELHLLGSFH